MSGFWLVDQNLTETHITGDPNMSETTLELLTQMSEFALDDLRREGGADDDE